MATDLVVVVGVAGAMPINLASRIFCKTDDKKDGVIKLPSGTFTVSAGSSLPSAPGVPAPLVLVRRLSVRLIDPSFLGLDPDGIGEFVSSRASFDASGDTSSLY